MVGDHRDVVHNSWRANEVGQDSRNAGMRVKFIPYSEYKYERLEKGGIRIEIRSSTNFPFCRYYQKQAR